jgi:hypothetical protein
MKQAIVVHKDCAKKSMELSTQLELSKAQLDMMRLPGGHCRLCTNGLTSQTLKFSYCVI